MATSTLKAGPSRTLSALAAGSVAGVLTIIQSVSFAALIFSGPLSAHIPEGLGIALVTAAVVGLIGALTSSYPGTVAVPQNRIAPLLALIAMAIVDSAAAPDAPETFLTVVAAILVVTLATGTFLTLLGSFRLGNLIRFMPHPVIGGLLAGTGVLLVGGSIRFMTGITPSIDAIPSLLDERMIASWLPGACLGLTLLVALRRFRHFLSLPIALAFAAASFYAVLWLLDISVAEARTLGLLLHQFAESSTFVPLTYRAFAGADWSALMGQIENMTTILVVSAVSILLNASATELAARREIDINRELFTSGIANLGAGLGGGMVGFSSMSLTALTLKSGVQSRLVGITAAIICAATLLLGSSAVAYVPVPILGGLLLYIGLALLSDWLYDTWFTLPRSEYAVILIIVAVVGAAGYLQGVAVGLMAAIVLFIVNYSRVDIVRLSISGSNYPSKVERPNAHVHLLREQGDQLQILKLHGFIFFGTAQNLIDTIRRCGKQPPGRRLRFVLVDFTRVTGMDSSAVTCLIKLAQMAEKQRFSLVFTNLDDETQSLFRNAGVYSSGGKVIVFNDIDNGIEWCEDLILEQADTAHPEGLPRLQEQLAVMWPETVDSAELMDYLEGLDVDAGETLIRQGDPSRELYFLESGKVSVYLQTGRNRRIRLRSIGAGTALGELAFYLDEPRSASVIADSHCRLYRLTNEALARMADEKPQLVTAFQSYMLKLLADRLYGTTATLRDVAD